MTRAAPMSEPQDVLAEALRMRVGSMPPLNIVWADALAERVIPALKDAGYALVRTPESLDGTTTDCPLAGVHEHAFRGPHRFHEWDPADYASPAPDPGAADWRHLLGWLDLPDGATLGEVEAAALGLGRHQGQAPCRDEEHVLRPWVKWCGNSAIHDPHDVAESRREDEYLPPSRCPGAASPAPDPGAADDA